MQQFSFFGSHLYVILVFFFIALSPFNYSCISEYFSQTFQNEIPQKIEANVSRSYVHQPLLIFFTNLIDA